MRFEYAAKVKRHKDGDSLVLDVDLGLNQWWHDFDIRLFGIAAAPNSSAKGKQASTWLADLLPAGSTVYLRTIKDSQEKFGRYLALLYLTEEDMLVGGISVNDMLIDAGYAVPWDGRGPQPTPWRD